MAERVVELDEQVIDAKSEELRNAVDRAERAEAELAKLKRPESSPGRGGASDSATQVAGGAGRVGTASMDSHRWAPAQDHEGHAAGEPHTRGVAALREDSMMAHLLDALDRGEDLGHYGRLVFAMIARHFLSDEEVVAELTKDRDFSEEQARQMLVQVEGRDYNPPRRDRIMKWQAEQEFPIIPNEQDPDCGNVYKTLRFPKEIYDQIGHYQEEKSGS